MCPQNLKLKTTSHVTVIYFVSGFYNRKIIVPTFNFTSEVTSLLHNDNLMREKNLIKGYDIMTGETNGRKLWDPETIQPLDPSAVTTPIDKNSKLREVTTGYLYQESVSRLFTQSHHVPIPPNFFYDKVNLDTNGGMVLAPLIFTFEFFKNKVFRKTSFWRILDYIPNLDIGHGKSSTKSADEKKRNITRF